jgi:hypothetical protein
MYSNETHFVDEKILKKKEGNITRIQNPTWKQLVQYTCNATGKSISKIITTLAEHGLQPQDIVHLEYLENTAILAKADINIKEKNYYQKKSNLIKYLQSWILILESKKNPYTTIELSSFDKTELQERILITSADGDTPCMSELKYELSKRD